MKLKGLQGWTWQLTLASIDIKPGEISVIPTGISVSIPKNYEIQIRPRSGLAAKNQISVLKYPWNN